jgi:hypothetical protein
MYAQIGQTLLIRSDQQRAVLQDGSSDARLSAPDELSATRSQLARRGPAEAGAGVWTYHPDLRSGRVYASP